MPMHDPALPIGGPARRFLPDDPSLEWLKRRAKQLRDAHAAGNEAALGLVATYDPGDGAVTLGRSQRVIARAFGFAGWSKLREHLATIESLTRAMDAESDDDGPVNRFLRLACLSYSEPAVAAKARAILADELGIDGASVYTLAASCQAEKLAELLASDPAVATREGGPHRWPPLLYLCFSRLDLGDAVASMRILLDAGADPNSGFLWKGLTSPFTALTGVLGGGERGEPMHPKGLALAELLLDSGADPNDNQAFYNRMFLPDDEHLGPLLSHGAGRPHDSPWRDRLGAAYPSAEEMVGEHLRSAAEKGFTGRVRRLLEHGVDPNTIGYHPILSDATAYEMAVCNGHWEAAALLEEAGGHSDRLDRADLRLSAVLSGTVPLPDGVGDLPGVRPDAMRLAAEQHGIDALERLIAVGFDVSARGQHHTTALHEAAFRGDGAMARWLIAQGADRSAQDDRFDSTPSGWAAHKGHSELAEELAPEADSVPPLATEQAVEFPARRPGAPT